MEIQKLTDREQILMETIWSLGDGVRLAYMVEKANQKYKLNWKPQTASTFLNKLVLKGFVSPYREGQYVHYSIVVDKEEYMRFIINQDIDFWTDGDITAYIRAVMGSRALTTDEIKTIKADIKRLEKKA